MRCSILQNRIALNFSKSFPEIVQYRVNLQGQQLTKVNSIVHLGHAWYVDSDDKFDIMKRISKLVSQVNYFLAKFGHLSVAIKAKLFAKFCQSFYGCDRANYGHGHTNIC